jgi:uncharacterized protein (DUF427 family)
VNDNRPVLQPSEAHPITISPTQAKVVVRVGDEVVAESTSALTLQEGSYPPVQYVPIADVPGLRPTTTASYCPYKGDASYFTLATADGEIEDAVWSYQDPYPAVAEIAGHVAFYPNKVTISVG